MDGVDADWSPWSSATSKSYDLANGAYTFSVGSKDEAGNINQAPPSYSFVVNAAPKVTSAVRTNRSVWASRVTLESPAGAAPPTDKFVLLPQHSGMSDSELVPVRIHPADDPTPCGANEIVAGELGLPTRMQKAGAGWFITLPVAVPPGQSAQYDILWGKINYFGWQEFVSVPKGFPNEPEPKSCYLDADQRLWRLTTRNVKYGVREGETKAWVFMNVWDRYGPVMDETVVRHEYGQPFDGSYGHSIIYTQCQTAATSPRICLFWEDVKRKQEGTLVTEERRYGADYFDASGSFVNTYDSPYLEWTDYRFPSSSIRGNLWFMGRTGRSTGPRRLWFHVLDSYGDEHRPPIDIDTIENPNGASLFSQSPAPVGENVLLLWEDWWNTAQARERQRIKYQVCDDSGNLLGPTTVLTPVLDDSDGREDRYAVQSTVTDKEGKVWLSYFHVRSGQANEFYTVVLQADGSIWTGPTLTPERVFRFCDLDGYIWLTEGEQFTALRPDGTQALGRRTPAYFPTQEVDGLPAAVSTDGYRLFDRWSPQMVEIDVPSGVNADFMELFDLNLWNNNIHVANLTLKKGDTPVWNHPGPLPPYLLAELPPNTLSEGGNVLTATQDDFLGGQVLLTFPYGDTIPPVIRLLGQNPMPVECGTPYVEPGYTASDDTDGDITAQVVVTGSVHHTILGAYTLRYSVSDSSGNPAKEETRTVNVVDTTAPLITLLGANPMTSECGTPYVEPGYAASDTCEGDLTSEVVVSGSVNHAAVGTYVLRYNVSDSSGNPAMEKSRTVNVVDTTPPVITLLGANPMTLECGNPYVEPGYTATDGCCGDLTSKVTVTGSVNHLAVGTYVLEYNVSDTSGNPAPEKTRTVNVVDTTPPAITLLGANPMTLECGTPYVEPGYAASDTCEGDLTSEVVVSGSVNHAAAGTYVLRYNVSDSSGDPAMEKSRTVNVVDTTPPVITLLGANPMTLECGNPYVEPGYTATDGCCGDLTSKVTVTGSVNHLAVGTYVLEYNVSDTSGNPAPEKTRTVNVVDTSAPVIVLLGANPMTLECCTPYVEPGYTVADICCGDITAQVVVTGSVDNGVVGTYVLCYNVSDCNDNPAEQKCRTIKVVDTTPPVITLLGDNPMAWECGTPYVDPGYSATDACEGDLTADVVVTGTVDENTPGTYELRYNVTDSTGNPAVEQTRTVNVFRVFRVLTIIVETKLWQTSLTWTSEPGRVYTVWSSGELLEQWEQEQTVAAQGDVTTWTDVSEDVGKFKFKFYKVQCW